MNNRNSVTVTDKNGRTWVSAWKVYQSLGIKRGRPKKNEKGVKSCQ